MMSYYKVPAENVTVYYTNRLLSMSDHDIMTPQEVSPSAVGCFDIDHQMFSMFTPQFVCMSDPNPGFYQI